MPEADRAKWDDAVRDLAAATAELKRWLCDDEPRAKTTKQCSAADKQYAARLDAMYKVGKRLNRMAAPDLAGLLLKLQNLEWLSDNSENERVARGRALCKDAVRVAAIYGEKLTLAPILPGVGPDFSSFAPPEFAPQAA